MDVDNLHTRADRTSEYMLLVYRLGRAATISQLLDIPCKIVAYQDSRHSVQDFIHTTKPARLDTYFFIPASPTNPAVLKDEMVRLVKTPCLPGDQWTVITGDQATYEAAVAIKDKLYKDEFNNVVLPVRWISPGSQLRQGHL